MAQAEETHSSTLRTARDELQECKTRLDESKQEGDNMQVLMENLMSNNSASVFPSSELTVVNKPSLKN